MSDQPDNINGPAGELDLRNLEEKEVIVIKDNEQRKCINTDGAVCLFKPSSLEDVNIIQQHLLEKTKKARHRETHANSFGYLHHDSTYDRSGERSLKRSSKSYDGRTDCDGLKDKGSVLVSVIQKILQEIGLNPDDICLDKNRG
ncbi:A-kinase anchor protein 4-like [Crotalus adamanteus]|uniref:A-kinase anchor protein 4-like n=1 Tax=Crotalus adamanteus TaxID=8729 RepID=A0AAW1CA20_CROAD